MYFCYLEIQGVLYRQVHHIENFSWFSFVYNAEIHNQMCAEKSIFSNKQNKN